MIKALIVDDEIMARNSLYKLLGKYCPDVKCIGTSENVSEAFEAIQKLKPDIVFLDIEMPGENGFKLLERFKILPFEVIFTTAYSEHAIKAFRYAALDYLCKPIDFRLLIESVGRFKEKQDKWQRQERMELLLQNLNNTSSEFRKIALPTSNGYLFEQLSKIVYCQANINYTYIHLLNGKKILVSKTLKEFENTLPTEFFFRAHKSYLINMNLISEYCREGDCVILVDNSRIPIATRLKKSFLERVKFSDK